MSFSKIFLAGGLLASAGLPANVHASPIGHLGPFGNGDLMMAGLPFLPRSPFCSLDLGALPPEGLGLWEVADVLATAHVALGIEPSQDKAWTDFATAAMDLSSAPLAMPAALPDAPVPVQAGDAGPRTLSNLAGIRELHVAIENHIEEGRALGRLASAIDALSAVLTPSQVEIADRLLAEHRLPADGDEAEIDCSIQVPDGLSGGPDPVSLAPPFGSFPEPGW